MRAHFRGCTRIGTVLMLVVTSAICHPNYGGSNANDGVFHQNYQYSHSSSSFKNNELQHKTEADGFFTKDGDLNAVVEPKVDQHHNHQTFVNPHLRNQGLAAEDFEDRGVGSATHLRRQGEEFMNTDLFRGGAGSRWGAGSGGARFSSSAERSGSSGSGLAGQFSQSGQYGLNNAGYQGSRLSGDRQSSFGHGTGYSGGSMSSSSSAQESMNAMMRTLEADMKRQMRAHVQQLQDDQQYYAQQQRTYDVDLQQLRNELQANMTRQLNAAMNARFGSHHSSGQSSSQSSSHTFGSFDADDEQRTQRYDVRELEAVKRRMMDALQVEMDQLVRSYSIQTGSNSGSSSVRSSTTNVPVYQYRHTMPSAGRYPDYSSGRGDMEQRPYNSHEQDDLNQVPEKFAFTPTASSIYVGSGSASSSHRQQASHSSYGVRSGAVTVEPASYHHQQRPAPIIRNPNQIVNIAQGAQARLQDMLLGALDQFRDEHKFVSSVTGSTVNHKPDYAGTLREFRDRIHHNVTAHMDSELRRAFGAQVQRGEYWFATGSADHERYANYRQADLERLREQIEQNMIRYLEECLRNQESQWDEFVVKAQAQQAEYRRQQQQRQYEQQQQYRKSGTGYKSANQQQLQGGAGSVGDAGATGSSYSRQSQWEAQGSYCSGIGCDMQSDQPVMMADEGRGDQPAAIDRELYGPVRPFESESFEDQGVDVPDDDDDDAIGQVQIEVEVPKSKTKKYRSTTPKVVEDVQKVEQIAKHLYNDFEDSQWTQKPMVTDSNTIMASGYDESSQPSYNYKPFVPLYFFKPLRLDDWAMDVSHMENNDQQKLQDFDEDNIFLNRVSSMEKDVSTTTTTTTHQSPIEKLEQVILAEQLPPKGQMVDDYDYEGPLYNKPKPVIIDNDGMSQQLDEQQYIVPARIPFVRSSQVAIDTFQQPLEDYEDLVQRPAQSPPVVYTLTLPVLPTETQPVEVHEEPFEKRIVTTNHQQQEDSNDIESSDNLVEPVDSPQQPSIVKLQKKNNDSFWSKMSAKVATTYKNARQKAQDIISSMA